MPETDMEKIYLYVPPEEYAEVKASGACWDDHSKRWYIGGDMESAAFSRWSGEAGEAEFAITSDEALVATAHAACVKCHERIEVICVFCESGVDSETGEEMRRFTVSNIWEMDVALAAQLGRWRFFRRGTGAGAPSEDGGFANYCPHCGAMQEEYLLHDEPGDVFFCIPEAEEGLVEFTRLSGRVRVSGDCGFGI
jgi:hypothetical protein